jgi:hypothetical protein
MAALLNKDYLVGSGLGGFGLKAGLSQFDQFCKGHGVLGSEVRQNLAVNGALSSLEAFNKTAVGHASSAGCCIDTSLPECAEGAFLVLTITIRILHTVVRRVGCVAIKLRAAQAETLGCLDCTYPAFTRSGGICYTHRSKKSVELMAERKALGDSVSIGLIHFLGGSE